jgi:Flp pilus assembly protein TadG
MRTLVNNPRRRWVNPVVPRRGATVVEMAICAPVLFALVFGAVEFSQVNMIRNSADNAAYEGARAAVTPGATAASARKTAKDELTNLGIRGATVTVTPSDLTGADTVTIDISVPLNKNFWTVPKFFKNITLNRTCTLQIERTGRD